MSMYHPIFAHTTCTDNFVNEYMLGASPKYVTCNACSRIVCTGPDAGDYESGEYERLRESAKHDSAHYVFLGNDIGSISYGMFDSMQFVFDCICNYARFCEEGMTVIPESPPNIEHTKPGSV